MEPLGWGNVPESEPIVTRNRQELFGLSMFHVEQLRERVDFARR